MGAAKPAIRRTGQRVIFKGDRRWVKRFSKTVGELIWAANRLHGAFAVIFCTILNRENWMHGSSMWTVLRTDAAQRDLLIAYISSHPEVSGRIKAGTIWAAKEAERLSEVRNDAVHTDVAFFEDDRGSLTWNPFSTHQSRAMRFANETNLLAKFRRARGDMLALADYIIWMDMHFDKPKESTLPKRPRLLCLPTKRQGGKKRRRKTA